MDLPEDILKLIFDTIRHVALDQVASPVLAVEQQQGWLFAAAQVCRHWRLASLSPTYRTLWVCIDTSSDKDDACRSNIPLVLANAQHARARHVTVLIYGPESITPEDLALHLDATGLFDIEWPTVELLHFSQQSNSVAHGMPTRGLTELNQRLIHALPSLRRLVFADLMSTHVYKHCLFDKLIRSSSLVSLRVFSDAPPRLCRAPNNEPIRIARLHIDGVTFRRPLSKEAFRLVAHELVELTLGSVSEHRVWEMFVPKDNDAGELVFEQLRALELVFYWESRFVRRLHSDTESEAHSDSGADGGQVSQSPGFMTSSRYGVPKFPALRRLEIRRFGNNISRLLSLFKRTEGLQTLVLAGLQDELPATIDYAEFPQLQSLNLRIVDPLYPIDYPYVMQTFRRVFSTTPQTLTRFALSMRIDGARLSELLFPAPTEEFAQALRVLRLDVSVGEPAVVRLVQALPRLTDLVLESTDLEPITSIAQLIQRVREMPADLPPASLSLERLVALNSGASYWPATSVHRGLLANLVARMPKLHSLCVVDTVALEVRKAVKMLVSSGTAAAHAAHFQTLRVLPWAENNGVFV
ncbi:hypothetical protein GGF43_001246 [Coemansia sp. RSA 2618]|nr:hypothetical protein GGF43_001246 [Coemansia sp. RSA 2618]